MTQLDTSPTPSPTTPAADPAPPDTESISDNVKEPIYIYLIIRELTPAEQFTEAICAWAKSKVQGHIANALIDSLVAKRSLQSDVKRLVEVIDSLPPEAQALVIELVAKGAFTRRELREPKHIVAYFDRPDWTEIVATWRGSPLPEIWQVIQGIKVAQRRKEKEATVPPPAISSNRRGNRDDLANLLKTRLPSHLRTHATDFAEGIRALASDPEAEEGMNVEDLAAMVRRRRAGTGTKICHRAIRAGLPHLAELGYVIIVDNKARIRPGALV